MISSGIGSWRTKCDYRALFLFRAIVQTCRDKIIRVYVHNINGIDLYKRFTIMYSDIISCSNLICRRVRYRGRILHSSLGFFYVSRTTTTTTKCAVQSGNAKLNRKFAVINNFIMQTNFHEKFSFARVVRSRAAQSCVQFAILFVF